MKNTKKLLVSWKKFSKESTLLVFSLLILIVLMYAAATFVHMFQGGIGEDQLTPELASKQILEACIDKDKEPCYANEFKILTQKTEMKFARETLAKLQSNDPQNANGCHLMAHAISIAETHKNPENWLNLLKDQDVYQCSGGFLHGVLEAHMGSDPSFTLDANQFALICNQVKDPQRGRLSCNHNLGHLLLVQEEYDFHRAIRVCSGIKDFYERYECLSGMFMENLTRLNLEAHGLAELLPWNEENTEKVEKLCKTFTDLPAQACWKVISYMYTRINNTEPQGLFDACNKRTPTKKTAEECYIYGVGNMVTFNSFNPENLKKICTVYSPKNPLYERCMYQVIGGMLNSTLQFSDRTIEFCFNSYEEFKDKCFTIMGSMIEKVSSVQTRMSICSGIPSEYQTSCKGNN